MMPPIASICRSGIPAASRAGGDGSRRRRAPACAPLWSVATGRMAARSPPGSLTDRGRRTTHPARRRRHVVTTESTVPSPGDRGPVRRGAQVPAVGRVRRAGQRRRRASTRRPSATSRRSGRSSRASGSRWIKPFEKTLEWDLPFAKWFIGGKLNVAYNCVDRHVENGLGNKVAYHWIGEPGDTRTITYADLQREVSKTANALLELGIRTGDRVAIYMPMIPELPIAMLACARIGAPHTVVFGGFSAEALSGRIQDCAGEARHHRRRRLAARQAGRPQAGRRRGAPVHARRSSTSSSRDASATPSRAARR